MISMVLYVLLCRVTPACPESDKGKHLIGDISLTRFQTSWNDQTKLLLIITKTKTHATITVMNFDFTHTGAKEFGENKELEKALKDFEKRGQGFLSELDKPVTEWVKFANEKREDYDTVVVIGVGGSALGARLLSDYFDNDKLLVLDTLDPYAVEKVLKSVNMVRTLWVVVSKSGGTLETMTIKNLLEPGIPAKNWVVVSEEGSSLWEWAKEKGVKAFGMPASVGGRFSILTAVGMVPATIAGLPIDKIISGAQKMREKCLSANTEENPAWQLAHVIQSSGKKQVVHWAYCSALRTFGAWWTQLVSESLGKELKGLTPIAAVGPTDQHSLLQLVAEGPDDFFNVFVKDNSVNRSPLGKMMNIELIATAQSLAELKRPSCTVELRGRDAKTLGELIVLWEMVVAFLGEINNINVFNQPGVERGKVLTKEMLEEIEN